jgi:hypothetical protein
MSWLLKFWDSTVGKKVVMAVTGILLVGFVLGHMPATCRCSSARTR